MSRKLFAFYVSDLDKVRIVCSKCEAATEMSVEQLSGNVAHQCRFCQVSMQASQSLLELARSIVFLKKYQEFKVEFVLPDESAE